MNYSQVQIANAALQRIGALGNISSLTQNTPNAQKVNNVWDLVFQEVLSRRDWKFAKTKVTLQQSTITPVYGYFFAYPLPSDFLRLCKPKEIPQERRIANAYSYGFGGWGGGGWFGFVRQEDVPVWPREAAPYIVETLLTTPANPPVVPNPTYTTCLMTNYGLQSNTNPPSITPPIPVGNIPLSITYIRLITDLTQLMPGFVNCLTFRLAAELAISITEDKQKATGMYENYKETIMDAQSDLECDDYLKDEAGSQSWIQAGRYIYGRSGWFW